MFVPPVVVTLLPILATLILLLTVALGTTVLLRALTVITVGTEILMVLRTTTLLMLVASTPLMTRLQESRMHGTAMKEHIANSKGGYGDRSAHRPLLLGGG